LLIDERAVLPRRIFVGFDNSADARQALSLAADLARATRFPLAIFHANPESEGGAVLTNLKSHLAPYEDLNPELIEIEATPMTACVDRFVRSPDTLFVMGARGRHRLSDWLLGTWTECLHYHSRATLLVCGPTVSAKGLPREESPAS
jgi:nucleotide-binding universal stress UspA family protein